MPRVAVLTDSSSDLTGAQAAAAGIRLLPLTVQFDGQEWTDVQDEGPLTLGSETMFRRIRAGADIPGLQLPALGEYLGLVEGLLETHDHVLALHTSPLLGRVHRFAFQATAHLAGRVTVFNSGTTSAGLAFQAVRAAELLRGGHDLPGVIRQLRAVQQTQCIQLCLSTLEYLRRGHLISGLTELFGTIQNMKPIFGVSGGQLRPVINPRGAEAALQEMLLTMQRYAAEHPQTRVSYMHNGAEEVLRELRAEGERLGFEEVYSLSLGAVLSSFVGPNTYGFVLEPRVAALRPLGE